MEQIYDANNSFGFSSISFLKPTSTAGGNYCIKTLIENKPIYIQSPQCITRQGIIASGKKYYCDLMFTNEHEPFIQWMEKLEQACQASIYEHRDTWFDGDMDQHDIENYFTPPMKLYKSGKFYILRTNVSLVLGKPTLTVFDEDATKVSMESIAENTNVMTILEIQGIKCSARSFQIEIELKQLMVIKPSTIFNTCLLVPKKSSQAPKEPAEEANQPFTKVLEEETEQTFAKLQEEEPEPIVIDEEVTVKVVPNETESSESVKDDSSAIYLAKTLEKVENGELAELSIHLDDSAETMTLKNRNEVHYEIYAEARKKAKDARDLALASYLEAKRIKNLYMLDELSSEENEPIL